MSEFIVNEAKFVIDMDDGIKDDLLRPGQILPGGVQVGELVDRAADFQLYEAEDGGTVILAVRPDLAERWVQDGYLSAEVFMRVEGAAGPVCLILSPAPLVMTRVTALRAYGSLRYALNVAAALESARRLNPDISLRDGVYVELYSMVLPAYTKTRPVCDRALFLNVLSKDQHEDLSSRAEMSPSEINFQTAAAALRQAGFRVPDVEPYLSSGESVHAVGLDSALTIAGPVSLSDNFQLYACLGEDYLLLLEPEFASQLIASGQLQAWELLNVRAGGRLCRALVLSKRKAVETLNDRHFGLDLLGAVRLGLALKQGRQAQPEADFSDALYVAPKGVLLAQSQGGNAADDRRQLSEIAATGPFACAPFDFAELSALEGLLA